MNQILFTLKNTTSGKVESFAADLTTMEPAKLPVLMAGPFLYEFSLDDGDQHNFKASVWLNENKIEAHFPIFPTIVNLVSIFTAKGHAYKITEAPTERTTQRVVPIKPSQFDAQYFFVIIENGIVSCGIIDNTKPRCMPFYNIWESGSVCMGGVRLTGPPINQLETYLSGITTPHITFSKEVEWTVTKKLGKLYWNSVGVQLPRHALDIPIHQPTTKHSARLMPC